MERGKRSKMYNLNLSYQDYLNSGRSIANTRIDKYIVYDELGRGAFGAVYKGMDDETKNLVAIKVLDLHAIEMEPNERVK
jgi:serine/threonine protein kinase